LFNNNSISFWDFNDFGFELNVELKRKNQNLLIYSKILKHFCTIEDNKTLNVWSISSNSILETHNLLGEV